MTEKTIAPRKFPDSHVNPDRISSFLIRFSFAVLIPLMIVLSLKRAFVHDEFEALKSAWKIYSGELIYVDFFQHHHPLLYFLLIPLFLLFGESTNVIMAGRFIILLFALGIFLSTYKIAQLLFSKQAAAVSVILLFAATLFVDKAIEIRPDIPQTFFGLVSIYLMFNYFASGRILYLILSALSLGIAFLFLQKILFLAILLHALLAWRFFKNQISIWALLIFPLIFLGTWSIYCLYLLLTDQFSQYFFFNFEYNLAKLEQHHYQTRELLKHLTTKYNAFALFGLVFFPWTNKSQEQREFALMTGALLIITALHRTQYAQYYFTVLPLLAIIAASGWEYLAKRQQVIALLGLAIVVSGSSAVYINDIVKRQNGWQLQRIAYVYNVTGKADYVYDGDINFNLFRKDLDFFWFGVGATHSLDKYRLFKPYEYNIYALIDKFKPKLISDYAIDNLDHPVIRNHYIESDRFQGLYLRTDKPIGAPKDPTGTDSAIAPGYTDRKSSTDKRLQ